MTDRSELVTLLRRFRTGIVSTVAATGAPQSAMVGLAVGHDLELVFDTLSTTRKYANLSRDPRVAVVMGEGELTVQLEGRADVPIGSELAHVQAIYFAAWPDGRERASWPHITWVRIRPTWIRVSDFAASPPAIEEHML
ncbi:MAG TPA: pyridoxamine 5'-phosphate oxidase family protein [Kofleriaceae bacterium]|nr:pyridoxamine 5'-phosphate oxidase family protein [Kofleriaceae bacterium]